VIDTRPAPAPSDRDDEEPVLHVEDLHVTYESADRKSVV